MVVNGVSCDVGTRKYIVLDCHVYLRGCVSICPSTQIVLASRTSTKLVRL